MDIVKYTKCYYKPDIIQDDDFDFETNLIVETEKNNYNYNYILFDLCLIIFFIMYMVKNYYDELEYDYYNIEEKENEMEKETEKETDKKTIKYEEKYIEKYNLTEKKELSVEKLESLKNSLLFETTPFGNIIMFYDHSRETFTYYSDNTMPYRFLETVGRKYVIIHDCKQLFVDMEEELKDVEDKKNLKRIELENIEKDTIMSRQQNKTTDTKKSVFAKLKSYNKDTTLKSSAKPATSNTNTVSINEVDAIVKLRANRYSYEGKIANFSFLKKVDRKIVDKKYSMSFSEFKKMNQSSFI